MTDAQRDELEWLRMKAASPEMVTVPRALLAKVLWHAEINSNYVCVAGGKLFPDVSHEYTRNAENEKADIAELRAIAGLEYERKSFVSR
jgi:hypothetical protein